jgi:hypothetical protein
MGNELGVRTWRVGLLAELEAPAVPARSALGPCCPQRCAEEALRAGLASAPSATALSTPAETNFPLGLERGEVSPR